MQHILSDFPAQIIFLRAVLTPYLCVCRVLQCMETGMYVGAIVVIKMNSDGSPLAPEKEGTTGKLKEFNKSWCRVSVDGKVQNFRKRYLEIHPDSIISREALQEKFQAQQRERKALRLKLQAKEDALATAFASNNPQGPTAAGASADGVTSGRTLPIDITPLPVRQSRR